MSRFAEFFLPILFASAEGVLWVLLATVLFLIGRGYMQPSEKPIFIERVGRYSMRLEPGLNLAQPFIEAAAEKMAVRKEVLVTEATKHFEVFDNNVATRKQPSYLLSIRNRDGLLRFEARMFPGKQARSAPPPKGWECPLDEVLQAVAAPMGVRLAPLPNGSVQA